MLCLILLSFSSTYLVTVSSLLTDCSFAQKDSGSEEKWTVQFTLIQKLYFNLFSIPFKSHQTIVFLEVELDKLGPIHP